ncbi:hypothetical protein VNO77_25136 [Canavalia gladiata]|uniref:Uncharacterized protein n=1 Tax=Canavalia gladiata TaxID=3824 RepID=A0AAN9L7L2_CANGL
MSHRKSHSHGSIPFSWEDKPGVCKTPHYESPLNMGSLQGMNQKSSSTLQPPPSPSDLNRSRRMLEIQDKKIPLPPCLSQPPSRSTSGKGIRRQEDPFLVAYKECTKSEKNCKLPLKNKKGVGSNFSLRKSTSIFSCRGTSDVKDDIYLKLSQLPRLPPHRDRSLTLQDEVKRGFNYDSWL